jgi:CHAD domain-containing protein
VAAVLGNPDEALRQARRILRGQLKKGLRNLDGRHAANPEDVHDARKHIKKARATLRLLQGALARGDYRNEDHALRDAARPLSAARDAKVLVDALDELSERYRGARHIKGARRFRRTLLDARARAQRRALKAAGGVRDSRKLMRRARAAAKGWSLGNNGWDDLTQGAVRLYRQGREALDGVRIEPSVECLHQWRKQTKYLYLQLELLGPVCSPRVCRLAQELHELSDDLGDDHDLAGLREAAAVHSQQFPDDAGATALMTVIERSRTRLQRKALLRGARLYRAPPSRFARLLG